MYIYTYMYLYITRNMGARTLVPPSGRYPGAGGDLFDFGIIFIRKTARSSASCDGPQRAASNAAIESFWRCIFVEI